MRLGLCLVAFDFRIGTGLMGARGCRNRLKRGGHHACSLIFGRRVLHRDVRACMFEGQRSQEVKNRILWAVDIRWR